ncbi:myb-like protein x [Anaeramoeba flamelloides]|uniref:Myb-like protein x n=1 Tax=Anaeramoeba flamelloides TaxID=1746091 RepID=A0AAV7ZXC7_9EUKA|nr:myb-like protein x [Anaeramoeba flamelloides]
MSSYVNSWLSNILKDRVKPQDPSVLSVYLCNAINKLFPNSIEKVDRYQPLENLNSFLEVLKKFGTTLPTPIPKATVLLDRKNRSTLAQMLYSFTKDVLTSTHLKTLFQEEGTWQRSLSYLDLTTLTSTNKIDLQTAVERSFISGGAEFEVNLVSPAINKIIHNNKKSQNRSQKDLLKLNLPTIKIQLLLKGTKIIIFNSEFYLKLQIKDISGLKLLICDPRYLQFNTHDGTNLYLMFCDAFCSSFFSRLLRMLKRYPPQRLESHYPINGKIIGYSKEYRALMMRCIAKGTAIFPLMYSSDLKNQQMINTKEINTELQYPILLYLNRRGIHVGGINSKSPIIKLNYLYDSEQILFSKSQIPVANTDISLPPTPVKKKNISSDININNNSSSSSNSNNTGDKNKKARSHSEGRNKGNISRNNKNKNSNSSNNKKKDSRNINLLSSPMIGSSSALTITDSNSDSENSLSENSENSSIYFEKDLVSFKLTKQKQKKQKKKMKNKSDSLIQLSNNLNNDQGTFLNSSSSSSVLINESEKKTNHRKGSSTIGTEENLFKLISSFSNDDLVVKEQQIETLAEWEEDSVICLQEKQNREGVILTIKSRENENSNKKRHKSKSKRSKRNKQLTCKFIAEHCDSVEHLQNCIDFCQKLYSSNKNDLEKNLLLLSPQDNKALITLPRFSIFKDTTINSKLNYKFNPIKEKVITFSNIIYYETNFNRNGNPIIFQRNSFTNSIIFFSDFSSFYLNNLTGKSNDNGNSNNKIKKIICLAKNLIFTQKNKYFQKFKDRIHQNLLKQTITFNLSILSSSKKTLLYRWESANLVLRKKSFQIFQNDICEIHLPYSITNRIIIHPGLNNLFCLIINLEFSIIINVKNSKERDLITNTFISFLNRYLKLDEKQSNQKKKNLKKSDIIIYLNNNSNKFDLINRNSDDVDSDDFDSDDVDSNVDKNDDNIDIDDDDDKKANDQKNTDKIFNLNIFKNEINKKIQKSKFNYNYIFTKKTKNTSINQNFNQTSNYNLYLFDSFWNSCGLMKIKLFVDHFKIKYGEKIINRYYNKYVSFFLINPNCNQGKFIIDEFNTIFVGFQNNIEKIGFINDLKIKIKNYLKEYYFNPIKFKNIKLKFSMLKNEQNEQKEQNQPPQNQFQQNEQNQNEQNEQKEQKEQNQQNEQNEQNQQNEQNEQNQQNQKIVTIDCKFIIKYNYFKIKTKYFNYYSQFYTNYFIQKIDKDDNDKHLNLYLNKKQWFEFIFDSKKNKKEFQKIMNKISKNYLNLKIQDQKESKKIIKKTINKEINYNNTYTLNDLQLSFSTNFFGMIFQNGDYIGIRYFSFLYNKLLIYDSKNPTLDIIFPLKGSEIIIHPYKKNVIKLSFVNGHIVTFIMCSPKITRIFLSIYLTMMKSQKNLNSSLFFQVKLTDSKIKTPEKINLILTPLYLYLNKINNNYNKNKNINKNKNDHKKNDIIKKNLKIPLANINLDFYFKQGENLLLEIKNMNTYLLKFSRASLANKFNNKCLNYLDKCKFSNFIENDVKNYFFVITFYHNSRSTTIFPIAPFGTISLTKKKLIINVDFSSESKQEFAFSEKISACVSEFNSNKILLTLPSNIKYLLSFKKEIHQEEFLFIINKYSNQVKMEIQNINIDKKDDDHVGSDDYSDSEDYQSIENEIKNLNLNQIIRDNNNNDDDNDNHDNDNDWKPKIIYQIQLFNKVQKNWISSTISIYKKKLKIDSEKKVYLDSLLKVNVFMNQQKQKTTLKIIFDRLKKELFIKFLDLDQKNNFLRQYSETILILSNENENNDYNECDNLDEKAKLIKKKWDKIEYNIKFTALNSKKLINGQLTFKTSIGEMKIKNKKNEIIYNWIMDKSFKILNNKNQNNLIRMDYQNGDQVVDITFNSTDEIRQLNSRIEYYFENIFQTIKIWIFYSGKRRDEVANIRCENDGIQIWFYEKQIKNKFLYHNININKKLNSKNLINITFKKKLLLIMFPNEKLKNTFLKLYDAKINNWKNEK